MLGFQRYYLGRSLKPMPKYYQIIFLTQYCVSKYLHWGLVIGPSSDHLLGENGPITRPHSIKLFRPDNETRVWCDKSLSKNHKNYLRVLPCDRHTGRERAVDGEDDTLRGRRHHGQRHVQHGVVTAYKHSHGEDSVPHGVLCREIVLRTNF